MGKGRSGAHGIPPVSDGDPEQDFCVQAGAFKPLLAENGMIAYGRFDADEQESSW